MTINHTKLFLKFSICLCFVLLPTIGSARTLKAIFLGASGDSPVKAYLVTATESVEVELPRRYLSAEVKLPDGELTIVVAPSVPLADTPPDPSLPRVKIPESCNSGILLFLPDSENKVFPVRVMFIDKSSKNFPSGHALLFNLSSGNIGAKFGDLDVMIAPNKSKLIAPPSSDLIDYKTAVAVRYKEDEKWTVFYRSIWRKSPNVHKLIFVTPTPGRKYPRIWSVLDYPTKPKNDSQKSTRK